MAGPPYHGCRRPYLGTLAAPYGTLEISQIQAEPKMCSAHKKITLLGYFRSRFCSFALLCSLCPENKQWCGVPVCIGPSPDAGSGFRMAYSTWPRHGPISRTKTGLGSCPSLQSSDRREARGKNIRNDGEWNVLESKGNSKP